MLCYRKVLYFSGKCRREHWKLGVIFKITYLCVTVLPCHNNMRLNLLHFLYQHALWELKTNCLHGNVVIKIVRSQLCMRVSFL